MESSSAVPNDKNADVQRFIDLCNQRTTVRRNISYKTAVKFLHARKFDIPRAVSLYEQHEEIRLKESLYDINPDIEPLHTELETGKFTILSARDSNSAAIALFTASKHSPLTVSHKTTLQGIVYQLDCALEDTETQRAGIVFIYDMSGSKYSNFDYELSQKILTLLKGGYPARLKKVLIVTAPLWFKAPFKILRLFVREKLRERVFTVSVPSLGLYVPRTSLPGHLGGSLEIKHDAWLQRCRHSMTNREDELLANIVVPSTVTTTTSTTTTTTTTALATTPIKDNAIGATAGTLLLNGDHISSGEPNRNIPHDSNNHHLSLGPPTNGECSDIQAAAKQTSSAINSTVNGIKTATKHGDQALLLVVKDDGKPQQQQQQPQAQPRVNGVAAVADWENSPSSASSGFSDDDSLAGHEGDPKTIQQVVEMLRERGRDGLAREYAEIKSRDPNGTFDIAKETINVPKNRYTDVLCYDHSRVVLSQLDDEDYNDEPTSDYINANFVDGYKQKRAYISTQGPLPRTSFDFWRMVWEQQCLVIVMTTRVTERGRNKCGQYWQPKESSSMVFGNFEVRTISRDSKEHYTLASLELRNLKTDEVRNIAHFQYTSWPDYGVPAPALSVLDLLQKVRDKQAEMIRALDDTWAGHPRGPPIVVHCSAGIGRTGTFITLDICISRLEDVGNVDIRGTVERIRAQRAHSIQMPDQYVFCHLALIEYALSRGMLSSVDLSGFDRCDSG